MSFRYHSTSQKSSTTSALISAKEALSRLLGHLPVESQPYSGCLGFENAQQGDILIDGKNANLDEQLLAQIGWSCKPTACWQHVERCDYRWQRHHYGGMGRCGAAGLGDELRALPMGLQHQSRQKPKFFGRQQRLAIARALAGHPRLSSYEPTKALDNSTNAMLEQP